MHKYRLISKKGEGTFSEVLKAQSIKNGQYVAIKCMKNHFDSIEQVNNLREIQALQRLSPNPHIVKLYEVLYDQPTGRLALVFELMHMNMYELIRGRRHYLPENAVKLFMYQLIKAMDHMHRNGIFHRDIKPENILVRDDLLKVADFGSCRGIYSKQPYTEYISTRWYRAPECLLTDGYYGYKMDMWGVGCVMFEIIALFPLFPGTNELDQISKVHKVLGTPDKKLLSRFKHSASHIDFNFPQHAGTGISKMIPHVSPECVDLIKKMLSYDPEGRLSARQALRHPWFRELREAVKMAHRQSVPGKGKSHRHRRGGDDKSGKSSDRSSDKHRSSKGMGGSSKKLSVGGGDPSLFVGGGKKGSKAGSLPNIDLRKANASDGKNDSTLPPIAGGGANSSGVGLKIDMRSEKKNVHEARMPKGQRSHAQYKHSNARSYKQYNKSSNAGGNSPRHGHGNSYNKSTHRSDRGNGKHRREPQPPKQRHGMQGHGHGHGHGSNAMAAKISIGPHTFIKRRLSKTDRNAGNKHGGGGGGGGRRGGDDGGGKYLSPYSQEYMQKQRLTKY